MGRPGGIELLVDTGFSGHLGLDGDIIAKLPNDYVYDEEILLAGGARHTVRVYLVPIALTAGNVLRTIEDLEAISLPGESLLGFAAMGLIGDRLVVDFRKGEITFQN